MRNDNSGGTRGMMMHVVYIYCLHVCEKMIYLVSVYGQSSCHSAMVQLTVQCIISSEYVQIWFDKYAMERTQHSNLFVFISRKYALPGC